MNVIGLALNGFDWPTISLLNFTAEPTYSFNNNSFVITLIVDGSSNFMNLITYNIIVVNSKASSLLDLQSPCK